MCTLSWRRTSSLGLEVFFNRDEQKVRPIADPPSLREMEGFSFLSPLDPKGGGTWMLANDCGLVICLLNKWELEGRTLDAPKSRGKLVWSLADVDSPAQVQERLVGLKNYHAFTLVALSQGDDRCWEWDGDSLSLISTPSFLTSSSFDFETVRDHRETYHRTGEYGKELHASEWEPPSAYSIRMNRPDAQTWSRSHLRVGGKITWEYLAEQPDLQGDPVRSVAELSLS